MNNIAARQNENDQIECLIVQRALYSQAKQYFAWRITIALFIAIVGPIVTSLDEKLTPWVGLIAVIYLFVNVFVLEKLEAAKKLNAAKFQELFDVCILELPWNQIVTGHKPDHEFIPSILHSTSNVKVDGLLNWYAMDVGKVPLNLGRFLCQRTNAWWDTKLRQIYIFGLVGVLLLTLVMAVVIGVCLDLTVTKLLLGIVVPLLPFAEVSVRQIKDNTETARTTEELRTSIDLEIAKLLEGETVENANILSRVFQDQIFRHRMKCPTVFDWLYNVAKKGQEDQMRFSVKAKVNQFLSQKT